MTIEDIAEKIAGAIADGTDFTVGEAIENARGGYFIDLWVGDRALTVNITED